MKLNIQTSLRMFQFLIEAIWEVINNSVPAVSFTINFKNCTEGYLNNRILDRVSTCWFNDYLSTWGYLCICWISYCHTLYWIIYLKIPPWKIFLLLGGLIHLLHLPLLLAITWSPLQKTGLRHMQLIANSWNAFSEVWGAVHKLTYPTKYFRGQSYLGFLDTGCTF